MAAIVKRDRLGGSTSYFVVYRDGSGRKRWEQFEREKPAKARKAQVELEMARTGGRWVPPVPVLFDKYAQEWLDGYAARAVRPRVLENYRRELRRARKAFGTLELAAVTRTHVKTLLAERAAAGAAANTLRNALIPLRECLAHAVDGGLIPSNPAARVPIPAAHKRKIVPPTRAQVEALILKAREDAPEALTLAAALGLRRGELFALRWSDVDFKAALVRVHATNERAVLTETTKSEAGERAVPLFESARRVFRARQLRLDPRLCRPDVPVFATAVGTPLDPGNFERREFKRALKSAGLEGAFRLHDLRHYAVSTLIAQRADVKLLQAIAGHSSATVTLDTYGHLMTDRVTEAAALYDPLRAAATG